MAKTRSWELEHAYFAYYHAVDLEKPLGQWDIVEALRREKGVVFDQSTISRMIKELQGMLATDPAVKDGYEKYAAGERGAKYFYKINKDGTIDSPYEIVKKIAERYLARKGHITDYLKKILRNGEKMWLSTGRKAPENWTEAQYNAFVKQTTQGSKYHAASHGAMYNKDLKQITGRTAGYKRKRIPDVLKLENFFSVILPKLQQTMIDITPMPQRSDMEFIVRVKPFTGIRTGVRRTGFGLWGTKIGPAWQNEWGERASNIQVIEGNLLWHVLDKKSEAWEINRLTPELRSYIINFVKLKQAEGKESLISEITSRNAVKILGQACANIGIEKLVLHDFRKVAISMWRRAGVPLDEAITYNVGWKDLDTAYEHYLAIPIIAKKEEEYMKRAADIMAGKQVAIAA